MARQLGRNAQLWIAPTNGGQATPVGSTKGFGINASAKDIDLTCQGDVSEVMAKALRGGKGTFTAIFDDAVTNQAFAAAIDQLVRKMYAYFTSDLTKYAYCTAYFDVDIKTDVGTATDTTGTWTAATPIYFVV